MTVPEPPEDAVPPVPAQADPPNTQPDPPAQAATASEDAVVTEERPHPLTPIVQIWVWLVAIGLFVIRQLAENPGEVIPDEVTRIPWWLLILLAIGLISVARNLWVWWTTRFVATERELRIDHKGVQHESKRVAYQRIQSVDITQRFAARLLGMAELTVDVGGGAPVRLQYLSRTRAVELRDFLLARAHGRTPTPRSGTTSAWDDAGVHDRVLLQVPLSELVLGAVLSHELWLLILAAGIPLGIGIAIAQPLLVGGGILPVLLSIATFVSRRVIGQYHYTLAETPAGLRITRGLTSLSSGTLPVQRVQAIRIHEPVLWRLIKRARVDLSFLGMRNLTTDEDQAGASSIMVPIGGPDAVRIALHAVWPGLDLDAVALSPAPPRSRWLAPLGWRWIAYGWDDRVVVFRSGWWTRTTWVMPHARLQSARVGTGPLRRRLGLATVEVHTTELGGTPSTFMPDADAVAFVYAEMARARSARGLEELLRPTPDAASPARPDLGSPAAAPAQSIGFGQAEPDRRSDPGQGEAIGS